MKQKALKETPFKHSYEEIAEEMGIKDIPRNPKFMDMTEVAAQYYGLIAQGQTSKTNSEVAALQTVAAIFPFGLQSLQPIKRSKRL